MPYGLQPTMYLGIWFNMLSQRYVRLVPEQERASGIPMPGYPIAPYSDIQQQHQIMGQRAPRPISHCHSVSSPPQQQGQGIGMPQPTAFPPQYQQQQQGMGMPQPAFYQQQQQQQQQGMGMSQPTSLPFQYHQQQQGMGLSQPLPQQPPQYQNMGPPQPMLLPPQQQWQYTGPQIPSAFDPPMFTPRQWEQQQQQQQQQQLWQQQQQQFATPPQSQMQNPQFRNLIPGQYGLSPSPAPSAPVAAAYGMQAQGFQQLAQNAFLGPAMGSGNGDGAVVRGEKRGCEEEEDGGEEGVKRQRVDTPVEAEAEPEAEAEANDYGGVGQEFGETGAYDVGSEDFGGEINFAEIDRLFSEQELLAGENAAGVDQLPQEDDGVTGESVVEGDTQSQEPLPYNLDAVAKWNAENPWPKDQNKKSIT